MTCSSARYSVSMAPPNYRNNPKPALGIVPVDMTQARSFTPDQVARSARHLILPEVGGAGQRKLLNSSVLLLGAGGLGSPAAMYLAAAGVGKLGIVDFDVVDASNLQRQLLHGIDDIGRPKVESAAETLSIMNPEVEVGAINEHLNSETALRIFEPYDVIVDGTDNFPTRYLANDAAHFLAKPLVHGSIFRFEGRLALFDSAKGTGCYRCLFPEPPPPARVQSCAEAGGFGGLPRGGRHLGVEALDGRGGGGTGGGARQPARLSRIRAAGGARARARDGRPADGGHHERGRARRVRAQQPRPVLPLQGGALRQ